MGGLRNGKVFGRYKEFHKGYTYESCEYVLQGGRTWESDREKRSSSWRGRWKLYAALVSIFFSLCVFPSEALAYVDYNEMGISWGPNVVNIVENNVRQYGVVVVTDNIYNAALITLGYSPLDSRLTHDVMAKLSNTSTGGAFYTFAQLVHKYYNGSVYDYPGWGNWGTLDVQANVYGRDYIYWVQYTSAQAASAKEDLEAILNGGSLGGGGSGGSGGDVTQVGDMVEMTFDLHYCTSGTNLYVNLSGTRYYYTTQYTPVLGTPFKVRIPKTVYDGLITHNDLMIGLYPNSTNGSGLSLYFVYPDSDSQVEWAVPNNKNNGGKYFVFSRVDGTRGDFYWYEALISLTVSGTYDNTTPLLVSNDTSVPTYNRSHNYGNYDTTIRPVLAILGNTGVVTPPPDTNWPDPDPTPTPQPPEVPEPDTPTTDPAPDPTFPIYVDVSTTNYTADLQGILDAMDDHCIHLQDAIWWGFNSFWNKLYQRIDWSVGVMRDEFSSTRDYLRDLFEWLAEQFDYSVSGGAYNDSTVVSWLKKIYSTLGLGVNTRPTDPVADPDGIGDWLGQLFANFIAWLMGFGAGLVAGLADDFAQLTHKFPFSIPWDIGAMLALIVSEPQAPAFDYPLYTMDASGSLVQAGTLEVDLSDFDSYMVGIRFMQKLLFCIYLAWRTPQLKELLRIGGAR